MTLVTGGPIAAVKIVVALLVLAFLSASWEVEAAVIDATSCSFTDVSAAVAAVSAMKCRRSPVGSAANAKKGKVG